MTQQIFDLIDAVNREGIDNSMWLMCQDVQDTMAYFGCAEQISLDGMYLCIYRKYDDCIPFIRDCGYKPECSLHFGDGEWVDCYKL